jgi:glycosyltransferase involved in cell wall biosynthesis
MIEALRRAGARVEEAHVAVFERRRDKSGIGSPALPGLVARLALAYLRLAPDAWLRLLRCDALMVGYIGQLDMLALAPLARLLGRSVVFNPLVSLTDTLVEDRRRIRAGSLPARVIGALDRIALRLADVVLVDTEENARFIARRFGVPVSKITLVPVGADEAVFRPRDLRDPVILSRSEGSLNVRPSPAQGDPSLRLRMTAQATLDVLFVGKFIPLHGIETIVAAAALLERRQAPVRIELVGTGQTYAAMRALADRLGVRSITWTDWVPYAELGERLRRADVALGIFGMGAKAGRVVPNKVYQSLACGIATVTRDSPAARHLLEDGASALLVPADDAAALADAVERLLDPVLRRRIAADGLAAYREHASAAALAAAVRPMVEMIACRSARG